MWYATSMNKKIKGKSYYYKIIIEKQYERRQVNRNSKSSLSATPAQGWLCGSLLQLRYAPSKKEVVLKDYSLKNVIREIDRNEQ